MAKQLRSTVRMDKVKSVYTGHIFSVRANQELENGFFVALGAIEDNNRDVHEMRTPTAGDKLYVVANPAIVYDNTRLGSNQERYYFMEEGEVVRAYELGERDVLSVSELGIDGDAVEGEYLVAGEGLRLVPSATPATSGFSARVVRFETVGGTLSLNADQTPTRYVVMEVESN